MNIPKKQIVDGCVVHIKPITNMSPYGAHIKFWVNLTASKNSKIINKHNQLADKISAATGVDSYDQPEKQRRGWRVYSLAAAKDACIKLNGQTSVSSKDKDMSTLEKQIGGNHYKNLAIQPAEYCYKNELGSLESSIIKYVTRYKFKNGVEDLKKAQHVLEMLIEFEEEKEDE